jgi:hypothetical protein
MTKYRWEPWARRNRGWLALTGVCLAAALCATLSRERSKHRDVLASRERARLAPLRQARAEADWTRQAVSYAGGAKGG